MKSENEDKKQLRVERTCIKFNIEIKGGDNKHGFIKFIDLPNSNLKYIEDGINAPNPEVYKKFYD